MGRSLMTSFLFLVTLFHLFCQDPVYEIFAIEFAERPEGFVLPEVAIGAQSNDSIYPNSAIWLLKGNHEKVILVDAGFTDTTRHPRKTYISPDEALRKIDIQSEHITDIIVTHPHWDHIGGIDLFPNAMLWMQLEDYHYFVGSAWQKYGSHFGFDKADVHKLIRKNLDGQLTLIDGDSLEIIPGITVFIGSKHTYESQYVLVNGTSGKTIIASDNLWFYYNLEHLLPIPVTSDPEGYIREMRRMKTLVSNTDLIIPGHDPAVFTKFPKVIEGVVRIQVDKE
jgi:glyoxylase-like metal-dependent hydrolase (beta-lactamase superfamily II)